MKKRSNSKSRARVILLIIAAFFAVIFVILPLSLALFDGSKVGNVALIPIEGVITGSGSPSLGQTFLSSKDIVKFIEQAEESSQIKVIVLEINSPGGSAVASDEIAAAVKKAKKPVIALIREVGASGGYWIASAADQVIANRMSITGSIGVISSYLEFSGLMEEYGVGYERLVAGEYKDLGVPFKQLETDERKILQSKLDKIHDFFIEEVARNRDLAEEDVRRIATGEFYLGVEALNLGLVDQLGDKKTVEQILQDAGIEKVDYVTYQREVGLLELLTGVFSDFSFHLGEGLGASLQKNEGNLLLI